MSFKVDDIVKINWGKYASDHEDIGIIEMATPTSIKIRSMPNNKTIMPNTYYASQNSYNITKICSCYDKDR